MRFTIQRNVTTPSVTIVTEPTISIQLGKYVKGCFQLNAMIETSRRFNTTPTNTIKKLDKALEIYDEVVLPMTANEDFPFLESIGPKHQITLFANAGCAFTCPSKTCYVSVSKFNKGDRDQLVGCSQSSKDREQLGMIDFDLQPLVELGFRSFKLLRPAPGMMTGF